MQNSFNINHFFDRYLCSSSSYRKFHAVTRRDLALVSCCPIINNAPAQALTGNIQRFQAGRKESSRYNHLDVERITAIHDITCPEKELQGLKTTNNWVGGGNKKNKAVYIAPPPEQTIPLLGEMIEVLSDSNEDPINKAVYSYFKICKIHPFKDGNGRTARLLSEYFLSDNTFHMINPLLYRLKSETGMLTAFFEKGFSINDDVEKTPFWRDAIPWSKEVSVKVSELQNSSAKKINGKTGLTPLSQKASELLDLLWVQPIVNEAWLVQKKGWNYLESQHALHALANLGILSIKQSKELPNIILFQCDDVISTWIEMDNMLISY